MPSPQVCFEGTEIHRGARHRDPIGLELEVEGMNNRASHSLLKRKNVVHGAIVLLGPKLIASLCIN